MIKIEVGEGGGGRGRGGRGRGSHQYVMMKKNSNESLFSILKSNDNKSKENGTSCDMGTHVTHAI